MFFYKKSRIIKHKYFFKEFHMKNVDKLYDYLVEEDKNAITTKELNQLGYSAPYIQKLIDSKVIQRKKL